MNIKKKTVLFIITILFFILIIYTNSYLAIDEKILYVGGDTSRNYTSINKAMNDSINGDTIFVFNGTYFENIKFYKAVKLIGEDKESTIIQYNGSDETVSILVDGCTFNGFTIRNSIGGAFSGINIESNNNVITNNIIENNSGWGIYMFYSSNNLISDNIFINDGLNIVGDITSWNTHTVENNTINGKPLFFYKNIYNKNISSLNAGQIILVNCTNLTIQNSFISNVDQAIVLGYSSFCLITKNILSNNIFGIRLNYASNNTISENYVENNDFGIYVIHSKNNDIFKNEICSNRFYGCYLCCNSIFNTIYLNNFTLNNNSAFDAIGNQWFRNKTGNYWDDYNGSDNDGDGIGDKPYDDIGPFKDNIDLFPIVSFKKISEADETYGFDFVLLFCSVFIVILLIKNRMIYIK